MKLSAEQQQAVERTGQDVCVVAGPGSGKTRVLTERFAWLVEQKDVDPKRILAITFTEKAAIEIKQRLIQRFSANSEVREKVEHAWVSTIHGFCARLLKENAIAAGLAPDFAVLEQAPAERMQREAAEEALDALFQERPADMRRLLEALDLSTSDDNRQEDLAASLINIYEAMRVSGTREVPEPPPPIDVWPQAREAAQQLIATEEGEWVPRFLALQRPLTAKHFETLAEFNPHLGRFRKFPAAKLLRDELKPALEAQWLAEWYADLRTLLSTAIGRLDAAYRARKRREAAVDFSDLEEFAVALLESNDEVRNETIARFDEVLMDELQDTNRLQWRLVSLVKSRLYAVGDINQSIYGFRHADPDVFEEYRSGLLEAGLQVEELRDNYRSRPEVLAAVQRVLDGQPGIEPRELIAKGTFAPEQGPVVERFCGSNEAEMVAARIREWHAAGAFAYKDVAVLVRTLNSTEEFEEAFNRAGIPYLVTGGRGFMEARETRDVMALLAALVNVRDEYPLIGVLRGPLMGLSDDEIYRLGRVGWRRVFEKRFGQVQQLSGLVPPDRLIAQALDACGYWGTLTERACANVDKLLAWLRREFRNRPRPLAELLEDLEALREAQTVSDAPPPEAGDVVRVMTIHAAKGLEFPVVFVSALHRRPDFSRSALHFSRELGLGAKWRNPVTHDGCSDPVHAQLKASEKTREAEEANRLLYVAMTRAEQRLILTHTERKQKSPWEKLAIDALPHAETDVTAAASSEAAPTAPGETLLEKPVVHRQYDSAVSITSVALFAACPRRYYLARYLGLEPEPEGPGTGAIAMGLAVHAALAGQPVESEEARELAENFRRSEWGQRAARAERIEHEFDFLTEIDDVILRGQIDLWFVENGELAIVDYKTDRDDSGSDAYALQLRLYALGLGRALGREVDRAVLFYVRSGNAVEVDLRAGSKNYVQDLIVAQESGEFPVKPGDPCRKCSFFRGLCPEGRRQEGVRSGLVYGPPSSSLGLASGGS